MDLSTTPKAVVQYITGLPEYKDRNKKSSIYFKECPGFRKLLRKTLCSLWNVKFESLGPNQVEVVEKHVNNMSKKFPIWNKENHYNVID